MAGKVILKDGDGESIAGVDTGNIESEADGMLDNGRCPGWKGASGWLAMGRNDVGQGAYDKRETESGRCALTAFEAE